MRSARPLLVFALALCLGGVAAAQVKPQEAILGKWEMVRKDGEKELKVTLEFLRDGKTTCLIQERQSGKETGSKTEEGTYRWLDDETLEVTVNKTDSEKAKVKVTDKELTITPTSGQALRFARVGR